MAIPPEFNEEFLLWFRARTEATWAKYPLHSVESFLAAEKEHSGLFPDWQRGTRWLDPLTDEEIDAIEEQWKVRFPPDYRLFYKWLHAVDRPQVGLKREGDTLTIDTFSSCMFHSWQREPEAIEWAYEHILYGLAFDAIYNSDLWRAEWGPLPATEEEARERLKPVVEAAPRMIPIYRHRYLLAEPCQAGNPIFSIWQSDIIIYGADLRTYLLEEWGKPWANPLGLTTREQKEANTEIRRLKNERWQEFEAIPFWGNYL